MNGPELRVRVHEAAIDGPIVGSSLGVALKACFKGITHFAFPALIPLTPGNTYAIEVSLESDINWGVVWQQVPDVYPVGTAIVRGGLGSGDLWFRTGLDHSSPLTTAYCADGLWQHLRQLDGTAFSDQPDCLQHIEHP